LAAHQGFDLVGVKTMAGIYLQNMVEAIPDERLPEKWKDFDLSYFSDEKTLFDYQQQALKNALKALWKYYEDFGDYQIGEDEQVNRQRKRSLWQWYLDNGLSRENFFIEVRSASLLSEYYSDYIEESHHRISYEAFINRMSFWMATGSGKTLVIVKLIEILARLIQLQEVPPCDILFLTHRDDLIEQLRRHVREFNTRRGDLPIDLHELKDYSAVKREHSLFQGVTVFYYRSDNLSDEQKEKIVDFRNYDNGGQWFILLDEAHKGDKEESKRQHIYSILSRNGFLFNFSATFTDARDIATTVFNFNLSEYIKEGYGKHLLVLQQEMRAFKEGEDYTEDEKRKMVLKALILLTYVRKVYEEKILPVKSGIYHRPLMLVLVNSVNIEEADLELFFRELERIASHNVDSITWMEAKEELSKELKNSPTFLFEGEKLKLQEDVWESISPDDLYRYVFNADRPGEIEVLIRLSNRQEMAFKLKTAELPFALIKIGDISSWLKEKLTGYEVVERFEDESYFAQLNEDDSAINILMGSRTFYEGWDSNRPNVICYINIGVGTDARKFVLQSVGRGVRIEPIKNKRRRLLHLYNADGKEVEDLFQKLKDKVQPLETLFIFGTNRQALQTIIETVRKERQTERKQLSLFEVNPSARSHPLLIPVYKQADKPLALLAQEYPDAKLAKLEVHEDEFRVLRSFVERTDNRVLLALLEVTPKLIGTLRCVLERDDSFNFDGRRCGDLRRLLRRVVDYLSVIPEDVERLKELEEEIRHFKHITVTLQDIGDLQSKIERVKTYPDMVRELRELYGKVPPEEYEKKAWEVKREEEFSYDGKRIYIKHIAQHYYLPIVLSDDEKVNYIQHIIKTASEVKFIRDLERYLDRSDNKFKEFDWWFFSKLDESLDEVYIPYYDPQNNRITYFKPDFIFWLQKGDRYFIVFVDPHGTEHIEWQRKVNGYCDVFCSNGKPRELLWNGKKVTVHLFLRTDDIAKIPEKREFWFDRIEDLPQKLEV
jgi:superfamily II DNA or RNA helicase